jgi:hypothetical protein
MEVTRDRIKATTLVNKLTAHVLGKLEMSPTQVQAAQILLKKVLPDLAAVDNQVSGQITSFIRAPQKSTDSDWKAFLAHKQSQLPAQSADRKQQLAAPKPPQPNGKQPPKLN